MDMGKRRERCALVSRRASAVHAAGDALCTPHPPPTDTLRQTARMAAPRLSQDLIPAAPKGARTICLPHFFSSRPQRGCGFVSRVLVAYKQAVFTPSYVLDTLPLQLSYNLLHAIKHMDMIQAYLYLNNFHTFPLTQFSQYKSDILRYSAANTICYCHFLPICSKLLMSFSI